MTSRAFFATWPIAHARTSLLVGAALTALVSCCHHAGGHAPAATPPSAQADTSSTAPATSPATPAEPFSPAASAAPTAPVAAPVVVINQPVHAAVTAADRSDADKAMDAGRKPEKLLDFLQIAPGQRVAELGAGMGYTAELLARVVGANGQVYGQNPSFFLEKFAEAPWAARVAKPINQRVVRVDREFDSPLAADIKDLDAVLMVLLYHDTVWLKADRTAMNKAIFQSLKPGGFYGVVDHSAAQGEGLTAVQTLHRIDEETVKSEVTAAGFELDASADFLRNIEDKRDWNASPRAAGERRGTSDRFVLRFKKPNPAK